jgi:hypothetical protein
MGTDWEVRVLRGVGHNNPREPQGDGREAGAEGSGERTCGPTNRNRIEGDADQSERAHNREALVTKGGGVDPAVVQERPVLLSGEASLHARKGDVL